MSQTYVGHFVLKALFVFGVGAAVYFRVHLLIWPILLPITTAAGLMFGRWEQRVCVVALNLTMELLGVGPLIGLFPHTFDVAASRAGVLVVGLVYLGFLTCVAVMSRCWWPSWVAAFQLMIIVSHLMFVIQRGSIQPWAYASSVVIWSWLQYIVISLGVWDAAVERWASETDKALPVPRGAQARCATIGRTSS